MYVKNRDKVPAPVGRFDTLPPVTVQLPIFNEMYVVGSADRCRVRRWTTRATCSRSRCWTTRRTRRGRLPSCAVRRARGAGASTSVPASAGSHRLQGRRTGGRAEGRRKGSSSRSSTPTSSRLATSSSKTIHHFVDPKVGDGAGALGSHQRRLLAPHEDPVDAARRALRPRARRAEPRRSLLQFQRHRGHLAARGDRGRRAAGSTTR